MYTLPQGRIPLKIGDVCVVSNKRHPLYYNRGIISQIVEGQIVKLVFIQYGGKQLVGSCILIIYGYMIIPSQLK